MDSAWVLVESVPPPATYYADETGAYEVVVLEGESPTLKCGKEGYRTKVRSLGPMRTSLSDIGFELARGGL